MPWPKLDAWLKRAAEQTDLSPARQAEQERVMQIVADAHRRRCWPFGLICLSLDQWQADGVGETAVLMTNLADGGLVG